MLIPSISKQKYSVGNCNEYFLLYYILVKMINTNYFHQSLVSSVVLVYKSRNGANHLHYPQFTAKIILNFVHANEASEND